MKKTGFNIFSLLLVIASLSFAFRLTNIITFSSHPSEDVGIVMQAGAVEAEKPAHAAGEEPPPLTAADVEKAVRDTAKTVEETVPDIAGGTTPKAAEGPDSVSPPAGIPVDENRSFSTSEIEVLQSLSKRRDTLDQRERDMDEREALLKAAEQEVDKKVSELNKLKAEIEQLLGQQEKMEGDRIASLVKIYEAMKPKEAAAIFNTLEMDVLLAVVSKMNERKLSPVLAAMDTDKARLVTIQLAEQRKLPGVSIPADIKPAEEKPAAMP